MKSYFLFIVLSILLTEDPALINSQNTLPQKTQDILEKLDFSKYPTPLYHQYIDDINGVSLDSLVSIALQNNKDLIATKQKKDVLQGKKLQAGLRPNPKVSLELLADQLSNREGEYDFSATYSQTIERGQKRQKRVRIAELEIIQVEKEITFQEQILQINLLTQYANLLANAKQLQLLERLVKLSEENFQIVQVKFKEGDAAKLDLQLTEVELNRWKTEVLQSNLQIKANLTQIKLLIGMELDSHLLKVKSMFPLSVPINLNLLELQNQALQTRIDLQVIRLGEEIAQARLELAKAQAKADVDVFAKYTQERVIDRIAIGKNIDTERKVGLGVNFSIPIYNHNQGEILEVTASRSQITSQREQLEYAIKQEVAFALARLDNAKEIIAIFEKDILPKTEDNLKILQVAYQLGEQDLLQVITEQRRLVESQREYFIAHKELCLSLIALKKALGATN